MGEARDLFFYLQLLAFELGDVDLIGKRSVDFVVDFLFEARMARFQSLDTVFHRHRQLSSFG